MASSPLDFLLEVGVGGGGTVDLDKLFVQLKQDEKIRYCIFPINILT